MLKKRECFVCRQSIRAPSPAFFVPNFDERKGTHSEQRRLLLILVDGDERRTRASRPWSLCSLYLENAKWCHKKRHTDNNNKITLMTIVSLQNGAQKITLTVMLHRHHSRYMLLTAGCGVREQVGQAQTSAIPGYWYSNAHYTEKRAIHIIHRIWTRQKIDTTHMRPKRLSCNKRWVECHFVCVVVRQ